MTVETTLTKAQFLGNGSARTFPLPFPVIRPEHVHLVTTDTATGVDTPVTAGYTVTGCGTGSVAVTYPASGNPLSTGARLTIYRQLPLVQQMDLENASAFDAEVIEATFDNQEMQIQQLQEQMSRAVTVAISDTGTPDDLRDNLFAAATDAAASAASAEQDSTDAAASAERAAASATLADAARERACACATRAEEARDVALDQVETVNVLMATEMAKVNVIIGSDKDDRQAAVALAKKWAEENPGTAVAQDAGGNPLYSAKHWANEAKHISIPEATETAPGITRYGTAAEHLAGAQNVAATPDGVRKMIVATPASPTAPGVAKGDETTIVTGTGGVLSLLPGILLQGYETAGTFTFTCPNPWGNNKPFGAEVQIKGGGGGGSSGQLQSPRYYGGQGGSEGELVISKQQLTPGETYQVVIGAGGSGGTNAGSTSNPGSTGGTSAFKAVITAMGGIGGRPPAQLQIANNGVTSVSSQESHLKGFVGSIPYSNTSAIGFGTSGAGRNGGVFAGNTGTPGLAARGTFGCGGAGGGCDDALNSGFGGAGGDGFCYIFAIGGGI